MDDFIDEDSGEICRIMSSRDGNYIFLCADDASISEAYEDVTYISKLKFADLCGDKILVLKKDDAIDMCKTDDLYKLIKLGTVQRMGVYCD